MSETIINMIVSYFFLREVYCPLKGVFAKNERGYRLNAIKKRI